MKKLAALLLAVVMVFSRNGVGPGPKVGGEPGIAYWQWVGVARAGGEVGGGDKGLKLLFLGGDGLFDLGHLGLLGGHQSLGLVGLGLQLVQKGLSLGHLGGLLHPLEVQLGLLGIQLAFGGVQPLQRGLHLLPGGGQSVHHGVVIPHDLVHHGKAVQKVGIVTGGEKDGPTGDGPRLLHGPGTLAKPLIGLLLQQQLTLEIVPGTLCIIQDILRCLFNLIEL